MFKTKADGDAEQLTLSRASFLVPKLQLRDTHEQEDPASFPPEAGSSTTDVSKPELGNEERRH